MLLEEPSKRFADTLFRLQIENSKKRCARRNDVQILVQHNERLSDGGNNALGVGPSGFDLPLGRLHFRDAAKGEDDALNRVSFSAIGQDAADIPIAILTFDLTPDRRKL